jgi:hypothetical protein
LINLIGSRKEELNKEVVRIVGVDKAVLVKSNIKKFLVCPR